jgi:hypothetical protein
MIKAICVRFGCKRLWLRNSSVNCRVSDAVISEKGEIMPMSNAVLAAVSATAFAASAFVMNCSASTILHFSGTDPNLIGDMYPVESLGVTGTLEVDLSTSVSAEFTTYDTYGDAVVSLQLEVYDINDDLLGTIEATNGDVRITDGNPVEYIQVLNFDTYTGLPSGDYLGRVTDNLLFIFEFPDGALDGRSLDKIQLIEDPGNFNLGTLNMRQDTVILDQFNVGEPYSPNRVPAPGTFALLALGLLGLRRLSRRVE